MRTCVSIAFTACLACGGTPTPAPIAKAPSPSPTPPAPPSSPMPRTSGAEPSPAHAADAPNDTPTVEESPGDPLPQPRVHLSLGGEFSCMVDRSEAVWCWGSNRFGQLGDAALEVGARSKRPTPTPVRGLHARRIAAGVWHVCALKPDGTVACWGHNGWGQLGDGTREDRATPVNVVGLRGVAEIAAGLGHSCARTNDRQLFCWGQNEHGQIGDGTYELRTAPTRVLDDVVAVVTGRAHTCALRTEGRVWCWGENLDGQLGDTTRSEPDGHRPTPAQVAVEGVLALVAGPGSTCVRTETDVLCWGRNDSRQLATRPGGRATAAVLRPTSMGDAGAVAQVALGSRFSCVRDEEGRVHCVGLNHRGQLGDGSRRLRRRLTPVADLLATELAAGIEHVCAIDGDEVLCWGDNRKGQLGVSDLRFSTTPTLTLTLRSGDEEIVPPPPTEGLPQP